MHLLLWKTTLEGMVLYFMNFTMVYYKNVGVLGDQYLAPFSLLPEFQSRIERENKSQTDGDQSITFVTDKLDNVTSDLQPRWLMILYFSLKQTAPKVSDRAGYLQVSHEVKAPESPAEHRASGLMSQPEALSPYAQPFHLPWAGVRKGQSGVNPKFLPVELWWCLGEKETSQKE